jgi:hypothetical protein
MCMIGEQEIGYTEKVQQNQVASQHYIILQKSLGGAIRVPDLLFIMRRAVSFSL